jgi:hypothetical protein
VIWLHPEWVLFVFSAHGTGFADQLLNVDMLAARSGKMVAHIDLRKAAVVGADTALSKLRHLHSKFVHLLK